MKKRQNNQVVHRQSVSIRQGLFLAGSVVIFLMVLLLTDLFQIITSWTQAHPEAGTLIAVFAVMVMVTLLFLGRRRPRQSAPVLHDESLEEQLAEYTSYLELNPHPVIEFTSDGSISYCNSVAAKHFPTLNEDGFAHPVLSDLTDLLAELGTGKQQRIVREIPVGTATYEQHIVTVPDSDRVRIYAFDTTERKHAEEARHRSETKFKQVFRAAPISICISRLSDGRFVDVNHSFVRLLGYENRHEIIGHTAAEIGMWKQGGERSTILELLSKSDTTVHNLEAQVRPRDGAARDVIVSIELMEFDGESCVLLTLLDVTERKEAEAGLNVLKAFYENTLKELPIEVGVLDAQARFFYLNPQALDDEEKRLWMVGKTSMDLALVKGLDIGPFRQRHEWLLSVIARKEIGQIEETLTNQAGEERHMLRVATPVVDENDEVIYVVGYGIDLTDRKAFEKKLLEAKNAAEELARLKSVFLANMSHEIRTPLTAILGSATVLEEELGKQHSELIEIIKQSGERLLETLNSVLDLARLESDALEIDPEPLALCKEVIETAQLFKPMVQQKGLLFEVDTPPEEVHAQLDRPSLHRILSNLLSNAIKFTDEGAVRLSLHQSGEEVCIRVEDTGIGIDDAFRPHLFQEFKQESSGLARTHTGSGLGLSITKHLVERMFGHIEVWSEKGRGSTFQVTFPLTIPDAIRPSVTEPVLDDLSLL